MRYVFTLFALFIAFGANAQVTQEIFESFKLQERREVFYYIPEDYDQEKKYPLVIVLDAEHLFEQVVANSKYYSTFHGMPDMIVVGINQLEKSVRLDDCAYDENGLPSEKGKEFFEFLGMELIPYLDLNYNTAPFKMIVGYDITANFINYWLYKENSLFNAYISISPTLAPGMETNVPARLADHNKRIFYQLIMETEKNDYSASIEAMNKSIKAIEKETLFYYYDEYAGADHISIAAYGIGRAFDNIFGMFKPISPKEYRQQILTSEEPVFQYLENKYNGIKDLFGLQKPVELNDIMAIYAGIRKKEDYESLKPLSELCKTEFMGTMLGFYFEGEYYEQMGEPKKALKTFEKAFGMDEIDFLTKEMALEKIDALKADFGY
ncbi:alpha/beta hydrolase [Maribacter sp. 2-571]|uniref:alpha/beta hydrolase n=1 Tax=Maribacter sp. 2-571 TaxID=3417569 RepID=UPI003D351E3E